MRFWFTLTTVWLLSSALTHSSVVQANTIYLIRHAEKITDGSRDPLLTIQGQIRAQNVAQMLSKAHIEHIYATDYRRTQLTAEPLATLLNLPVKAYNPSHLAEFAKQLKSLSGNVLVVGHSNTTPELTALLSGKPMVKLTEDDYDDVFQVIIDGPDHFLTRLKSLPLQAAQGKHNQ